jgi:hypothetical protein
MKSGIGRSKKRVAGDLVIRVHDFRARYNTRGEFQMQIGRIAAAVLSACVFAVALADCSQPNWATRDRSAAGSGPLTTDAALPPFAGWSKSLIGKTLKSAYPKTASACVGNLDSILTRYDGRPPGVQLFGWGWDQSAKKPIARVIIANSGGIIVGAGVTGYARPDVPIAKKEVHSNTTGWRAYAQAQGGPLFAWGILNDRTVCGLGHIDT